MEQTARARRDLVRRAAAPVLPEDLVVWEILVRLPAKTLLRCRAVCRSCRRRTSAVDFLLAHNRRQPSLPLVHFSTPYPKWKRGVGWVHNTGLDAVDIWRSPVERRPVLRVNDQCDHCPYTVHASCDGLLVVRFHTTGVFYICNPTTRQLMSLAPLTVINVMGLYPHGSSGEYRILCWWNHRRYDGNVVYNSYVLTVGSMAPRDVENHWATELCKVRRGPSVLLHGCLHWVHGEGGKVLVFDTIGESFRWMSAPKHDDIWTESHLFQINGTLGISQVNTSKKMIKLWMLKNYEAEVWLMKYQIKFPVDKMSSIANSPYIHGMVLSENGDVLVYCDTNQDLFHVDSTGKLLQKFKWDDVLSWPTREWFKESLVQHAFFKKNTRKPCFFEGL